MGDSISLVLPEEEEELPKNSISLLEEEVCGYPARKKQKQPLSLEEGEGQRKPSF